MTTTVAKANDVLADISNGVYDTELSVREARNTMLEYTDKWALSDYPKTDEHITYRQLLRDIPEQSGFPTDITWPVFPE